MAHKHLAPVYARKHDHSKLYSSTRWRKLRQWYLLSHPICNVKVCTYVASVVDHVRDHMGNEQLFFSVDNLQALCFNHHQAKTAATRIYGRQDA